MNKKKYVFVLLTAGLMFSTGNLRADDAVPASTTPAVTPAAAPASKSAAAPKKLSIKEQMKAASDLADAGKTDEAIAAYEAIGPLPSKRGESWRQNSEGLAYLEAPTPEPEKAVPVLEKSVAVNPDDYYAWNNLGSAYELTDQAKKAEDAYQKAIDSAKAAGASSDKYENNLKLLQAKTGDAPAASTTPAASDMSTPAAGADSSK